MLALWRDYEVYVIVVFLLFLALCGFLAALIAQNRRRVRSESTAMQAELRNREAKLSNALKIARLGDWEYDVARDRFAFSDAFYAIFRTTAEAQGGYEMSSADYAKKFLHPGDAHLVAMETQAAMETADPSYSRQMEHRFLYADGGEGVLAVRIFIQKDPSGKTIRTFGVNQDITEQKRAEAELVKSLAEKEVLLRELYHRTKNNMGVINSMLAIQSSFFPDELTRAAFAEAQDRIRSMSLVHEKLYEARDLSRVNLRSYILDLMQLLIASHGVSPEKVQITYDTEEVLLPIDLAIPCGLVLNELATNALKHAFPGDRSGEIRVELRREEDGSILLGVFDDGIGMPGGFERKRDCRMGLQTLYLLGERQLGATVDFRSGPGVHCSLRFRDNRS